MPEHLRGFTTRRYINPHFLSFILLLSDRHQSARDSVRDKPPSLCKISAKIVPNRQTDRQTDKQTYIHSKLSSLPGETTNSAQRNISAIDVMLSATGDYRDRLHWLPIQQRLEYKICLLIFKCLHQTAPVYLTVMSDPVSASASRRSHLRSAARGYLAVPRSRTTTYGQRSHCGTRCRSLFVTHL